MIFSVFCAFTPIYFAYEGKFMTIRTAIQSFFHFSSSHSKYFLSFVRYYICKNFTNKVYLCN